MLVKSDPVALRRLLAGGLLAATAGCSTSLHEVRAREPELRFAGVPASGQIEVARCIREVLDRRVGETIVQEIELTSDGVHVTGRLDEALAPAVFYDVAVREDATVARVAPGSIVPPDMLRGVIAACLGDTGPKPAPTSSARPILGR